MMPLVMLLIAFIAAYWVYNNTAGRKVPSNRREQTVIDVEATIVDDILHCPMCGSKVKEDFKVCPYCAYTLKLKCQSCGRELKREWKNCPYCETPVTAK